MPLELLYGVGLIVVMCAMVWIARPAKGQDVAPWLRVYIVGLMYVMTAFTCGILGVAILITKWP
jgi:hypothetical protein